MGKKSGPAAPTPPDPMVTAQAQGQMNKDTAITQAGLNRVDQYTPQGSLTYQQNGTWGDGTPRYSQTQTLSPEQQQLYMQQTGIANALNGLAGQNVQRVADTQSQNFSYDGMTPLQTGVGQGLPWLQTGPQSPQLQKSLYGNAFGADDRGGGNSAPPGTGGMFQGQGGGSFNPFGQGPGRVQQSFNGGQPLQSSFNPGQQVQGSLDFSGVGSIPGANDYGAEGQRMSQAMYQQAQSRLDPQFQQQQDALSARLANSGIPVGSEAWKTQMDQFQRGRSDAYNQANYSSLQAGANEQSRLFGLAMQARQQGVGEQQAQGQFANSAAAQQFGQNQGQAQFYNQAQGQQFAQGLQGAQFWNQGQDQRFQQNLAGAEFGNNAQAQQFQMGQAASAMNNQAQNQGFNQQLTNAQLNNAGRQQQIQEATYLRNLPLNEIAALMGTGGSVTNPTFNQYAQVGVAAPDYQNAVYNNYNAASQQYNQAQANRSQGLGSIFGALGSLGGAAIMASDIRLKENLKRIGTLANGIATYTFNYIGDRMPQFGVMAQEVRNVLPDAVIEREDGMLYVNYRKVFA